jgi:hypothetical protein
MDAKILRNKRAQLRRGKKSLIKRAHKFEKVHGVDIAIIMCNGSGILATNYEADCKSISLLRCSQFTQIHIASFIPSP